MDAQIRDRLARHRTDLSNERTLLAYVRTALGFMIVGVPAIWLVDHPYIQELGGLSLAAGVACLTLGLRRYITVKAMIARDSCSPVRDTQAEHNGLV